MAQLSIHLFGYPQIFIGDIPAKIDRRKTLALAAYLAVESGLRKNPLASGEGKPVSVPWCGRDTLAALFWPDADSDKAGSYLRQSLWDFSRALGDAWLVKDKQALGFNLDASVWVDVNAFRELYDRGTLQNAPLDALAQLAEWYQADFLSGFSLPDCPEFDEWQLLQTETLHLQVSLVLEALVDRLAARREFEEGVRYALRWNALDPLNEISQRALMQLYEENGQSAAALSQYEACTVVLKKELGIEPCSETVNLYKRILQKQSRRDSLQQETSPELARESGPVQIRRPHGTVTFLFTDIEGSTSLWERYPRAMKAAFNRQEEIMRKAMADHNGYVYKMIGDAFQVAFSTAADALQAALAAQYVLLAEPWGETGQIRVRMALHTGATEERENDYVGPTLNRVARVLSAGYGDQILVNQPAFEQLRELSDGRVEFIDLGEHHLKDLVVPEHIYQVCAPGLPSRFPPLKAIEAPSKRLPPQTTPFIGREAELAEIEARLALPDCRLVTLTGIGGSGKTRLAIQAASQSRAFQQNVFFVALEGVTGSSGLLAAIADAANLERKGGPWNEAKGNRTQALISSHLANKKSLLVLDNFEQLIGEVDILLELLAAAPLIKMIVTTRERLNLPGEWVMPVGGLSYPAIGDEQNAAEFPALQLFARTVERSGGMPLKASDLQAIARICQLLDGIPLGIEIAAGWVKLISCQDVVEELEKSLDFLQSNWRGRPERQRTIRAVFDNSWGMLTGAEKLAFSALSLFKGGFTREAAACVTGINLGILAALLDKSLLRRQSSERYEIHPLLSQYAAEKLAIDSTRLSQFQAGYASFFCDWISRMQGKLRGRGQREALNLLRAEAKNLAAVCQMLVEQRDHSHLIQFLPDYLLYNEYHNRHAEYTELSGLLSSMLQWLAPHSGAEEADWLRVDHPELLALVLAALRHFGMPFRNQETIIDFTQKSLMIAQNLPDSPLKAIIFLLNATGAAGIGAQEVMRICLQSIAIFQKQGDSWGVAMANLITGDLELFDMHDQTSCTPYYQDALSLYREMGNDWGQGKCLFGLATQCQQTGEYEQAYELMSQSAQFFEALNTQASYILAIRSLAYIAEKLGRTAAALQHYQQLLHYFKLNGDEHNQAACQERIESLKSYLQKTRDGRAPS